MSQLRRRTMRPRQPPVASAHWADRKSTRLNSSHDQISYAVFCLKKKSRLRLESGLLGERQLRDHRRSCARRAVERHCPAERLDSVLQPYKTRAASWVCPADVVVS